MSITGLGWEVTNCGTPGFRHSRKQTDSLGTLFSCPCLGPRESCSHLTPLQTEVLALVRGLTDHSGLSYLRRRSISLLSADALTPWPEPVKSDARMVTLLSFCDSSTLTPLSSTHSHDHIIYPMIKLSFPWQDSAPLLQPSPRFPHPHLYHHDLWVPMTPALTPLLRDVEKEIFFFWDNILCLWHILICRIRGLIIIFSYIV